MVILYLGEQWFGFGDRLAYGYVEDGEARKCGEFNHVFYFNKALALTKNGNKLLYTHSTRKKNIVLMLTRKKLRV